MGTINAGFRKVMGGGSAPIAEELRSKAPLAVGAAIVTDCSTLGAKFTILVPIIRQPGDEVATEHLRRAVKAALIAANMKQYRSIALPNMLGDEGGPTVAEAARAVVQEMKAHDKPFPEKAYMVDSDEDMIRIFDEAIHYARHSL